MAEGGDVTPGKAPWCFDPVSDLLGDLAALCLSFLDVHSLLLAAQHVNHAWQRAIDGGLPAVWHEVRVGGTRPDEEIAKVAQKSHGAILSMSVYSQASSVSTQGLDHLRSLCNLRVLSVELSMFGGPGCSISHVLPYLPLLEDLFVNNSHDVTFPPLQFLKKVCCMFCGSVKGLRNLPSLTSIDMRGLCLDAEDAWPASLREVSIFNHKGFDARVFDRIAALQQPTDIATDWSFVFKPENSFFTPPYDQLSFMRGFKTLQRLLVPYSPALPSPRIIFNFLGDMASLRELTLQDRRDATDDDMKHLTQLENLQQLTIMDFSAITNKSVRHISAIPNLNRLEISGCFGITDYSYVGLCRQLRELALFGASNLCLTSPQVSAISHLHLLTSLSLSFHSYDPSTVSSFCTIRGLRKFHVHSWNNAAIFAVASFACLPSLSLLEDICIYPVDSVACFIDRLVQMPRLERIAFGHKPTAQEEARLRAALPRLERIAVH